MSEITRLAGALADRYAVEREIGAGGMAVVYLARDLKHGRLVALKVLRPELGAALGAERFLDEIKVTAGLQHPNLLPLFDSGEADGLLFYVMPFVEGESLRVRLDREKQLAVEDAVRIATAVAGALDYAHRHGVIHRDIKPENILLSGEQPMVADFGIVKSTVANEGSQRTATGIAVGTPAYMSPEQATGEQRVDGRADVYSVGVMLYEMLTGELPFAGANPMAILAKRLMTPAPSVQVLRASVPDDVAAAIARALARDAADRFATAGDFAKALRLALATPPGGRPGTAATVPLAPSRTRASIAVLPFANLSADPENAWFTDGITEDVTAQLSKIRALKVISNNTVKEFRKNEQGVRGIGAALNVSSLLEGSVRRAGNRVRIVAQLVDAESDRHVWAETYDRDLTDIFAIQSDVALRIANALKAELSPEERQRVAKEPTNNLDAYQAYLKGRQCFLRWTEEGVRTGIEFMEQAIALDPRYALPWAGLAYAYIEIIGGSGAVAMGPQEALRRAREAVSKALEIDADLAAAHGMLAYLKFSREFDWTGAEREFKRAIELDPGNADAYDLYGHMLGALERYDEAVTMLRQAQELDPLAHRTDVITALLRAGRRDEALAEAVKVVAKNPEYPRAHAGLGWAYLQSGRTQDGLDALARAVSLSPGDTLWLSQLGQAYGLSGKADGAREVLRQLEDLAQRRYVSPYHFAYVFVGLGEPDRALDFLETAYEERSGAIYGIKGSFLFAGLRSHPRFTALLHKLNLA